MEVHRGPQEVADGIVHRPYAVPPLPDPDEGVLHQFFGLQRVVGDEHERPEQAWTLGIEELLERGRRPSTLARGHGGRLFTHRGP